VIKSTSEMPIKTISVTESQAAEVAPNRNASFRAVPPVSRPDFINTVSLYCTTAANYVVPLLVMPLFASRLRPAGFGQATTGLALAASIGMLIDYGFPFSGTRLVAQHHDSREMMSEIVSSIQGAKLLFTLVIVAASILAWPFIAPHMAPGESAVLTLGLISGLARGLLPLYFYQGVNRLAFPAAITSILRGLGMIAVIPFVRSPLDASILVAGDAAASGLNFLILTVGLYKAIGWRSPSLGRSLKAIRQSWSLFVFSLLASTYTSFGILVARSLAPYTELGLFGGADRLSRAASSAFGPIGQVAYPKISRMIHSGSGDARNAAKWSFYLNLAIGIVLFLIVFLGARPIVSLLLGPGYSSAVKVLTILSFQLLATSISRSMGVQWMLPLGLDTLMTKLIAASVVSYFALLLILAPRFGAAGMAIAFVLAEYQLSLAMVVVLHRRRLGWWQMPRLAIQEGA
jgi:PST family polysaccharide transporter